MTTLSELEGFVRHREGLIEKSDRLNVPLDVDFRDRTDYLWGVTSWRFVYYVENQFEAPVFMVTLEGFEPEMDGGFVFIRGFDLDIEEDGIPVILVFRLANQVSNDALANMVREYEKGI